MTRNTGGTNSETDGLETGPRDGGCPNCGRPTRVVDLSDFGPEAGQHCPEHGVVHATAIPATATDGGRDVDSSESDDCECDGLDEDLECWACYRAANRGVDQ